MKSIYEQYLTSEYNNLHPKIREKFGLCSKQNRAIISTGTMKIVKTNLWLTPLLWFGARKNITFPERGEAIPFTLENYAYKDSFLRETVAWIRKFDFGHVVRNFDATMIFNSEEHAIVDYFGLYQDFVSKLHVTVMNNGGIKIVSDTQKVAIGRRLYKLPKWMQAKATIYEWYDDNQEVFQIDVTVQNRWIGTIFAYQGTFTSRFVPIKTIPSYAKPLEEREEE